MNVGGIICEYNPFHNGHAYQIGKLREYGATHVVCVMSPNVVQRGEISLVDKWTRAATAVKNGADLVIELPTPYVLSSAATFAFGGISILKHLQVDTLCFGTEKDPHDFSLLFSAWKDDSFQKNIRDNIQKGLSYPAAANLALDSFSLTPNDILGLEYMNACENLQYAPRIYPLQRAGVSHDSSSTFQNFASASYLREMLKNGESIASYAPSIEFITSGGYAHTEALASLLLFILRNSSPDDLKMLPEVSEGLENRMIAAANQAGDYSQLLSIIKTKRYPMAKIKRTLLAMAVGSTKTLSHSPPPYLRILAMTAGGKELLKSRNSSISVPTGTSAAKLAKTSPLAASYIAIEKRSTDLFSLCCDGQLLGKDEYTIQPFFHL